MIFEFVAIALFLAIITFVYRFVTRDDRVDAEKKTFLDEVRSMTDVSVPEEEIRDYDEKREDMYKVFLAIKKKFLQPITIPVDPKLPPIFPEDRLKTLTKNQLDQLEKDFDEAVFIKGEWMKGLTPNDCRVLKSALFSRTMANLPRYEQTRSEVLGKFELLKRQLISDRQWNDVSALNQAMVEEINFIKREADLLENEWSNSIFGQAAHLRKQHEEEERRRHAQTILQARAKALGHSNEIASSDEVGEDGTKADVRKRVIAKAKAQQQKKK